MLPDFFCGVPLSSRDLRPRFLDIPEQFLVQFLPRFLFALLRNHPRDRFSMPHHHEMDSIQLRRAEVQGKILAEFPDRNRLRLVHTERREM